MKKLKAKKITALLLTAAMAFAMVGCGGDDAKDTSSDATTTPEATEAPAEVKTKGTVCTVPFSLPCFCQT